MNTLRRVIPPVTAIAQAWSGDYTIKGSVAATDCVVGFSFGYRGSTQRHITPGLSNQDLADVASRHYRTLPKVLQFEIADAYQEAGGTDATDVVRITKHRQPNRYLDTREVAVQAQAIMKQRRWKTALLLASPYHMPRVQAVCTQLGIPWVTDGDERGAVEFDPLSAQKWTRDLEHWRGYEPLALCLYRFKGWL